MQKVCVSSRLTQKLKSEELPWRNPQRAWCDIHVGVACGLVNRMQMWAWFRWGSGVSRYKSHLLSRKEPRQAEPSRAHQAEQWPKFCIVQSLLSLEWSSRGVDKPQALLPVHTLVQCWGQQLGTNIKKKQSAIIGCCSDLTVLKLLSSQRKERTSHSRSLSLEPVPIVWSVQGNLDVLVQFSKYTDRQEDSSSLVLRHHRTHWDLGGLINQTI